jgi:murein DD-endopeptidase MepM/ murein hydrolase activator NlpD
MRRDGTVSHVRVSRSFQIVFFFLLLGGVGWFSHVTTVFLGFDTILDRKNKEIARISNDNSVLSLRVAAMRNDITDVSGTLKRSHHHLVGLLAQNDRLRSEIKGINDGLRGSEAKRAEQLQRQSALAQQIAALEQSLSQAEQGSSDLRGVLDQTKSKLSAVILERSEVAAQRENLKKRLRDTEERIALLRDSHQTALFKVTRRTVSDIKRIESIIAKTGLNVNDMLRRVNPEPHGIGGPFIPSAGLGSILDEGQTALDRHLTHWEDLQTLMKRVPLTAPVHHYRVGSTFGRRRDPMNKRWAMHKGADFSAPSRTAIYAPADGKVVFRGWKGRYGRFIEIDHGYGIRTRYGHMRQLYVRRGQTVKLGQKIGQVGTSGRSTGPHLHYEIVIKGRHVDPMKFIEAGKDVFKG